jgi:hypothetical protein
MYVLRVVWLRSDLGEMIGKEIDLTMKVWFSIA